MKRAENTDREIIVNILVDSFRDNKSVNYIIKQDAKKEVRLRRLMEYSHDVCKLSGDVFITDDKAGCALIVKPDKKTASLNSILLDAKFVIGCLGLSNVKKAMSRESKIKSQHPVGQLYYLWFIGVDPAKQHKGIGSQLLKEVIAEGKKEKRTICLETSTQINIPWYQSFGFKIYNEMDFGYKLFCLKKE
jgi:ribosomal protein S18 acetylase RimI-like enzyme